MKIFLTGHKGNIGGQLFSRLKQSHTVCGFDIRGEEKKVGNKIIVIQAGKDLVAEEVVFSLLQTCVPDVIIHCAAIPSPRGPNSIENFENYWKTNVIGTKNVVFSALKLKVKKFIYFSSGSVYGWDDDLSTGIVEQYGISKRIAESIVRWAAGQGMGSSILRLAPLATTPGPTFFYATVFHETIFRYVMEAVNNPKWLSIYNVSETEYQGVKPLWKVGEIADDFIRTPNYEKSGWAMLDEHC